MSCKFMILNNAPACHWPVHSVLQNRFKQIDYLQKQPLAHWAGIKKFQCIKVIACSKNTWVRLVVSLSIAKSMTSYSKSALLVLPITRQSCTWTEHDWRWLTFLARRDVCHLPDIFQIICGITRKFKLRHKIGATKWVVCYSLWLSLFWWLHMVSTGQLWNRRNCS